MGADMLIVVAFFLAGVFAYAVERAVTRITDALGDVCDSIDTLLVHEPEADDEEHREPWEA